MRFKVKGDRIKLMEYAINMEEDMQEKERLQKYIASCGVCSRRAAEELILQGKVLVNRKPVTELGTKINPDKDKVYVEGNLICRESKKYYIMLNKPKGYVTTAKDQFERKTVLDLVQDLDARLYPVGRLDYDSEGLIFLSNDGDFTYHLTHPKSEVKKKYKVLVSGPVTMETVWQLRSGVEIDGKMTAPARVEITGQKERSTELTFVISEGRNRQIRKMCEAVGHEVIKLKRVAIGNVMLGNLPKGKWRHLTEGEIKMLMGGERNVDNQRGGK